jgi:hypothetical protein
MAEVSSCETRLYSDSVWPQRPARKRSRARIGAADEFRDHLRVFVDEARAAGITPVLMTPLTRRTWTDDGNIASTLTEYAEATSFVATEKDVP